MIEKSNIQISLSDFESENLFIFLDKNYKNLLLSSAIQKAGSQSKLALFIKNNINYPKINQATVSSFINKNNLRIDLVSWLCSFADIELDNSQILGLKGDGTSEMVYNPKLKIELSKELTQILANLYCDGSIEKANCYVSTYCNGFNELITRFKNNFSKCFGNIHFYERNTNVTNVRIPCFIGKLLYYKFDLCNDNVPPQIMNSSKEIKSAYLQAAFDDEGSVHNKCCQIRIKMKPKSYIEDIQKLVQELDIETSKVIKECDKRNGREYYYFLISGMYNLKKFYNEIGFFHPKKKNLLIKHLNNIKTPNYGYKAKNLVYNVLKENGPLTAKQIAVKLNRDKRIVHQHLVNLKKQDIVSYTKIKRKFVYEYLWKVKDF